MSLKRIVPRTLLLFCVSCSDNVETDDGVADSAVAWVETSPTASVEGRTRASDGGPLELRVVSISGRGDFEVQLDPSLVSTRVAMMAPDGRPRPVGILAAEGTVLEFVADEIVLIEDDPDEIQAFIERYDAEPLLTVPGRPGRAEEPEAPPRRVPRRATRGHHHGEGSHHQGRAHQHGRAHQRGRAHHHDEGSHHHGGASCHHGEGSHHHGKGSRHHDAPHHPGAKKRRPGRPRPTGPDTLSEGAPLPAMHLFRIDTSSGNDTTLADALQSVDGRARRGLRVSDAPSARLLAILAAERNAGRWVNLNPFLNLHQFLDGATCEGPTALVTPPGITYVPDAFQYRILNFSQRPRTGVTRAWQRLEDANRLGATVNIGVVDTGFAPGTDWPSLVAAHSSLAFEPALNNPNDGPTGIHAIWHGTAVVHTAMGIADNAFGGAGVAGAIARPIVAEVNVDGVQMLIGMWDVLDSGARMVNFSMGFEAPAFVAWVGDGNEAATNKALERDILIFASAGNEGKNVDRVDGTFGWEAVWHFPCENDGVLCVGGINEQPGAATLGRRFPSSNFGAQDVDLFAPWNTWVAPNPDTNCVVAPPPVAGCPAPPAAPSCADTTGGTSFASPHAAGVAALLWATNPSLTRDQVRNALVTTSRTAADPQVTRVVDADAAVASLLGDPIIIAPRNGDAFTQSENVGFQAIGARSDLPGAQFSWTLDGAPWAAAPNAPSFTTMLNGPEFDGGAHTITVSYTAPSGVTTTDDVTLNVDLAPTAEISSPGNGASLPVGALVSLVGEGNDADGPVNLVWRVGATIADATLQGTNPTTSVVFPSEGSFAVVLRVTDTLGQTAQDVVFVTAEERCGNGVVDPGETCDDGNLIDDDGCSSSCDLPFPKNSVDPCEPAPPDHVAPNPPLDAGEECTENGDCASGLCVPNPIEAVCVGTICTFVFETGGTCRDERYGSNGCPSGEVAAVRELCPELRFSHCAPPIGESAPCAATSSCEDGAPCQANDDCGNDYCVIDSAFSQGVCTSVCFDATDCPSFQFPACLPVSTSSPDPLSICME